MLDIIDVYEDYVGVLCLESNAVAPALSCDVCVYNRGCEGFVNYGDAVCTGDDVGIPWELLVVNCICSCSVVCTWGFL